MPASSRRTAKARWSIVIENIAHMGSSNVDNEECWLITAMARSLGLVFIDHQARV